MNFNASWKFEDRFLRQGFSKFAYVNTNQYQNIYVSNVLEYRNQQNSSELGRFGSDSIECDGMGQTSTALTSIGTISSL